MRSIVAFACLVLTLVPSPAARAADDPAGIALFEQKIRPVLVRECYGCHAATAKAVKGGYRLDTRDGLRAGGDSGPAVVPGKPDESPMLDALRHDGLAMPPKGKLPDEVVADFTRWIKLGAPDPRDATAPRTVKQVGMDVAAGRNFWAYQAPRRHDAPEVRDAAWPYNDVDRFIQVARESKNLKPAPDADRTTLARRLAFDLLGLPPTPEEVAAFVNDASPDAYEKLVDRWLASPRFGERWARHWLDVARFAESLTLRGMIFKEAWRYRDYVVETFNADRPIDQFLREQIAGDLLPADSLEARRRQRIATTFLVLGNTNLEEQDKAQLRMDVVDEQLDVIGKALLGQTLGCARCHDHKFDPIPTRDYYALAGILRNTRTLEHENVSKWLTFPLPDTPEREAEYRAYQAKLADLEARLKREQKRFASVGALGAAKVAGVVVDDEDARKVGDWKRSTATGTYIGVGYVHDDGAVKGANSITFAPELLESGVYEVRLAYSTASTRSTSVPVTVMSADGERTLRVDMRAEPPLAGRYAVLGRYRFEKDGQSYVLISNEGTTGVVTADAVVFLPAALADKTPASASKNSPLPTLAAEVKRLKEQAPRRALVMSVSEEAQIEDARIHVRGSVHTLGAVVPRGFLSVAETQSPRFSHTESGRRELAEWLASDRNPLTARVFVNRVWHWLFGAGLVRTTDNFGTTGELPSHPALLDDLASRFMEEDWSIKWLVRHIVTSHSYRISSEETPESRVLDPENRLVSHANRRRLDAECLRDAMLMAAGTLRQEMGGPTFPNELSADYDYHDDSTRRSLYSPVFRNALPEVFEAFDFADPSLVVGRREASTVAPQALFLINHPFVLAQARALSRRLLMTATHDDVRATLASHWILGRAPTIEERRITLRFVAGATDPEEAWARVAQALFGSLDFRFLN